MNTKKKKKMQCMWILNINDAWKKLVKYLKTENFPISIDRISIESGKESWLKIKGFSINRKTHSINQNSGNLNFFLKNCRRLCRNYSNQGISWMKYIRISLNVFQKHEFSTQNFKTKFLINKNIIFANP